LRRAPEPQEFLERLHPWIKDYKRRISAVLPQEMSGDLDRCDLRRAIFRSRNDGSGNRLSARDSRRRAASGIPGSETAENAEYLVDTLRNSFTGRLFSQELKRYDVKGDHESDL
jgi:hypothetical protein